MLRVRVASPLPIATDESRWFFVGFGAKVMCVKLYRHKPPSAPGIVSHALLIFSFVTNEHILLCSFFIDKLPPPCNIMYVLLLCSSFVSMRHGNVEYRSIAVILWEEDSL